jgi:hypothetical protein
MRLTSLDSLTWHKSSYSWKREGDCVEVARCTDAVAVRDSKDPDGPVLVVSSAAFAHFVRGLR